MTESHHFKSALQGIMLATTGWSFFAIGDAMCKHLTHEYHVMQVIFLNSLFGAIIMAAWVCWSYGPKAFLTPRWRWHLARGCSVVCTTVFGLNALQRLPLADFYGIVFLAPMMTTIMSVLFFGDKIGWHRSCAIIAGFIGVLVLATPSFDSINSGIFYGAAAVIFVGLNAIIVRKIGKEPVLPLYALFPFIFNTVVSAPLALPHFELPHGVFDYSLFAALAPITALGFVFYALGFARTNQTALVAPFHYTQIFWGILFGWVFFSEIPGVRTIAGLMIIIASGLYMIWREYVLGPRVAKSLEPRATPQDGINTV